MRRRQRKPETVTVPAHLAEPHVEHFVNSAEVGSLQAAQALAAARHTDEWSSWYAALPTATVSVPVVFDRMDLGTDRVDDVLESTGPELVGLTVAQSRRLLLGQPLPFRDQKRFERGMP